MKKFIKNNKRKIISIILAILALIAVSLLSAGILALLKIIYINNEGLHFNMELFSAVKGSWYGFIIFILLQTVLTILLCVIPGSSMALIILTTQLYEYSWQAFLISFSTVIISSAVMYLIGRFGGYKICVKILGKEDCEKSLTLLRTKGTMYFPLMMLFPIFPDDALVMIAGTLKMKLKWFIPSIIIGRGIGIFTIVFGLTIIPFDRFTTFYDWVVFATVCIFWIFLVFKGAHIINDKLEERQLRKANEKNDEINND